jgi:hypothetical protein
MTGGAVGAGGVTCTGQSAKAFQLVVV